MYISYVYMCAGEGAGRRGSVLKHTGVREKDTPPDFGEENTWEIEIQKHKIGGRRAVSADRIALHGKGSCKIHVFLTDSGMPLLVLCNSE